MQLEQHVLIKDGEQVEFTLPFSSVSEFLVLVAQKYSKKPAVGTST
jgi:hypothetical protein